MALTCAAQLAARWRWHLHVVHALDPLLAAAASATHVDLVGTTRDDLGAFTQSAAPAGDSIPVCHVAIGSAADAVCEMAATLHADVIVAGARGLSGLQRLMMGTTVERIIRRARTSVLVVPGHALAAPPAWGPVLAAIEHPSLPGDVAVAANALARSLPSALHAVHVVRPLTTFGRWQAEAERLLERQMEAARRELTAAIQATPGMQTATIQVTSGPIADALIAAASRYGGSTPFLVLGRAPVGRGHAPGSIASRVIAQATTPVFIYLPQLEPLTL